jgi:hypothetical protein
MYASTTRRRSSMSGCSYSMGDLLRGAGVTSSSEFALSIAHISKKGPSRYWTDGPQLVQALFNREEKCLENASYEGWRARGMT